jgi:retron-type reverse transcriptase
VDGMSQEKIRKIIGLLRLERYWWTPVRREYIPKSNGKMRPLGIPTWSDKLLQEVMRSNGAVRCKFCVLKDLAQSE